MHILTKLLSSQLHPEIVSRKAKMVFCDLYLLYSNSLEKSDKHSFSYSKLYSGLDEFMMDELVKLFIIYGLCVSLHDRGNYVAKYKNMYKTLVLPLLMLAKAAFI